jgi:acetyl-CoA carboxylase biotin carboxyl carrier protein
MLSAVLMEIDDIQKIVELMTENDILELEMEDRKGKIRLVRGNHHMPTPMPPVTLVSAAAPLSQLTQVSVPPPSTSAGVSQESNVGDVSAEPGITISSPMVGTFYRAPSPDAKAYVEIGTVVEKDNVVCIIEAMKMMNEIQAETRGRVLKILVENGQPVEYEQPLFLLEPL